MFLSDFLVYLIVNNINWFVFNLKAKIINFNFASLDKIFRKIIENVSFGCKGLFIN